MPITGTWNGRNIVAMPPKPGLRSVEWTMQDSVSVVGSAFSYQSEVQDWMADRWECSASLPPMTRDQADAFIAWFGQLRGPLHVFQMGDPLARKARGTPTGQPVVNGSNPSRSDLLSIRGCTHNVFRWLKAGDFLQIGLRMHRVLEDVNSDGGGLASAKLWPYIREAPSDGDRVIVANTQGLFMLSDNPRKWSVDERRVVNVSFQAVEAL